jgi:hypothetical protein
MLAKSTMIVEPLNFDIITLRCNGFAVAILMKLLLFRTRSYSKRIKEIKEALNELTMR